MKFNEFKSLLEQYWLACKKRKTNKKKLFVDLKLEAEIKKMEEKIRSITTFLYGTDKKKHYDGFLLFPHKYEHYDIDWFDREPSNGKFEARYDTPKIYWLFSIDNDIYEFFYKFFDEQKIKYDACFGPYFRIYEFTEKPVRFGYCYYKEEYILYDFLRDYKLFLETGDEAFKKYDIYRIYQVNKEFVDKLYNWTWGYIEERIRVITATKTKTQREKLSNATCELNVLTTPSLLAKLIERKQKEKNEFETDLNNTLNDIDENGILVEI